MGSRSTDRSRVEPPAFSYLFTVTYGPRGVEVDAMLDVSYRRYAPALADAKLHGDNRAWKEFCALVEGLHLRSRFAGGGPYKVTSDTAVTVVELEMILQDKQKRGELEAFLNRAKPRRNHGRAEN